MDKTLALVTTATKTKIKVKINWAPNEKRRGKRIFFTHQRSYGLKKFSINDQYH